MTNDDGRVNEIRRHGFGSRLSGKTVPNDSNGSLNVVAGVSGFVHKLLWMVMAARFEVELDTADLDGVFKVQAIMEDWKEKAFLEVALPITPSLQYSTLLI